MAWMTAATSNNRPNGASQGSRVSMQNSMVFRPKTAQSSLLMEAQSTEQRTAPELPPGTSSNS
eukprot:2332390-Pyramimonas_sp.AAC.1